MRMLQRENAEREKEGSFFMTLGEKRDCTRFHGGVDVVRIKNQLPNKPPHLLRVA